MSINSNDGLPRLVEQNSERGILYHTEILNDPWKHRSSGMRCATCMWFVKKEIPPTSTPRPETEKGTLGRCRRHAPTMNGYPATFESDWCGDHKLDENKI